MKKFYHFGAALAVLVAATGCSTTEDGWDAARTKYENACDFDFSTVLKNAPLRVNYQNCGVKASVYFEVYDTNPVIETERTYTKRTDLEPLYAGVTQDDGTFNGNINLPSYVQKVWIYTPYFFAQTVIEADVVEGAIDASDTNRALDAEALTRTGSNDATYTSSVIAKDGWKTWLGEFDESTGLISEFTDKDGIAHTGYAYTPTTAGADYRADAIAPSWLYSHHAQVINISIPCKEEFRSHYCLKTTKESNTIVLTMLGGNTCWNSSVGYYYYLPGEEPSCYDDIKDKVIMLFPNTQDGLWTRGNAWSKKGVERGTAVQLKYYPNIAQNDSTGSSTNFPPNCSIGFVLATNAWTNGYSNSCHDYRATTDNMSIDYTTNQCFNGPRTAVYSTEQTGDWIIISFEDHIDDENFSDVVFSLFADNAIPCEPVPVDSLIQSTSLKGVYAFEDLWPNKGDYDMNDVVTRYSYEKQIDSKNRIHSESFIFQTFRNYATLKNGLAFEVMDNCDVSHVECAVMHSDSKEWEAANFIYEPATKVFILTDDMATDLGAKYKVTLTYCTPRLAETQVQPFIFRDETDGDKRWEVHIAKEIPTEKVARQYFGTGDDCSSWPDLSFYVRQGNYPFAFYLAGATEQDLSKLLDRGNESIPIDRLYPKYTEWVTSNGTVCTDWYK